MADVTLPAPADDEEYIIRKKPLTEIQILRNERDRLQLILDSMVEPNNVELRELGKIYHLYYVTERQLNMIKSQINILVK